jgi:hypothetical protein
MVTMVWVVSRSRLKVPPGTSCPCISPLTPSGQRNCASWASQPQKSVTLLPQPGGGTTKVRMNMWWHKKYFYKTYIILRKIQRDTINVRRCSGKVPAILVRF